MSTGGSCTQNKMAGRATGGMFGGGGGDCGGARKGRGGEEGQGMLASENGCMQTLKKGKAKRDLR